MAVNSDRFVCTGRGFVTMEIVEGKDCQHGNASSHLYDTLPALVLCIVCSFWGR